MGPVPPRSSPAGAPTWSGGTRTLRAALPHLHSRPPLRRVSGLAEPGKQSAGLTSGAVSDWLATPSIRTLPLREVLGAGSVGNARLRPLGRGEEEETRLCPIATGDALRPCLWPLVASPSLGLSGVCRRVFCLHPDVVLFTGVVAVQSAGVIGCHRARGDGI